MWTDNAKGVSAVFTTPGFVLTATASRISPKDSAKTEAGTTLPSVLTGDADRISPKN